MSQEEIEKMIARAIFHHELRFSAFGVVTAVLSLGLGYWISGL